MEDHEEIAEGIISRAYEMSNKLADLDLLQTSIAYENRSDLTPKQWEFCMDLTRIFYSKQGSGSKVAENDVMEALDEMDQQDSQFLILSAPSNTPNQPDQMIGYAFFKFSSDWEPQDDDWILVPCIYLYQVHLLHNFQGQGHGKTLLSILERLALRYSFPVLKLTVLRENQRALKWYLANGFSLDSTDNSLQDPDVGHVILSKSIE